MNAQDVIEALEKSEGPHRKDGKLFCPFEGCGYNGKKHFLQRKHLKQHLLKVHTKKTFKCPLCGKAFSTENFLLAHERQCGKKFNCFECGWQFNSREALLTHAKRRGHTFEEPAVRITVKDAKLEPKERKTEQVDQSVQTTPPSTQPKRKSTQTTQTSGEKVKKSKTLISETETSSGSPRLMDNSCQTTGFPTSMVDFFDDSLSIFPGHFDGSLCDMETQTDGKLLYSQTNTVASESDPLLYSHIYTQTYEEDILSELGLTDVQTQTTACPPTEFQDFLVSTETQTSFTQCLEEEMASFTTTYTQT
ncbi:uncharacterized protein LOC129796203 [Lutzomyia longipalpis]|uniref:uncharacterized protein LOC129796203 n=1 Tax=Lutzomyia longipalpis TaxID=7200 RepID=UPI0024843288|nr:uncharacterized protein LOC129796203 [Lutzomyia longipalpis]